MDIWQRLDLDPASHRLVTLVGGGGKTTLLYALARQALDRGRTVAVTTTTHMLPHPALVLTARPDRALLAARRVVMAGALLPSGKMTGGPCPAELLAVADVVLVEGDGAKHLPLKAPEAWEPVIPERSDAVIAVAGLDAVGQAIQAVCHRPQRVALLLGKPLQAPVTAADVALLLAHPQGGRKQVPPSAAFRCVLNQADDPARRAAGAAVVTRLRQDGIQATVTSFGQEERGGLCWF